MFGNGGVATGGEGGVFEDGGADSGGDGVEGGAGWFFQGWWFDGHPYAAKILLLFSTFQAKGFVGAAQLLLEGFSGAFERPDLASDAGGHADGGGLLLLFLLCTSQGYGSTTTLYNGGITATPRGSIQTAPHNRRPHDRNRLLKWIPENCMGKYHRITRNRRSVLPFEFTGS